MEWPKKEQKDKQRSTKHYTENQKLSNTDPTKNQGKIGCLRIPTNFLSTIINTGIIKLQIFFCDRRKRLFFCYQCITILFHSQSSDICLKYNSTITFNVIGHLRSMEHILYNKVIIKGIIKYWTRDR
jgi:hypothetical protein